MVSLMNDRVAWLQSHEDDPTSPLKGVGLASFVKTACELLLEKIQQVVVRDHHVTVAKDSKDLENFWTQMLVSLSETKGFGPLSDIAWQKRLTSLTLSNGSKSKAVLCAELAEKPGLASYLSEDSNKLSLHTHRRLGTRSRGPFPGPSKQGLLDLRPIQQIRK